MRPFNSWDRLKLIALLFMFIDHAGVYFYLHDHWIRSIGRGAAPLFLFLAGYAGSYRFSGRLLALACLMQLSNMLSGHWDHPVNILFNILLCRAFLHWMERKGRYIEKPLEWFIVLALFAVPGNVLVQYGTLGMLFAACGYMRRFPQRYSRALVVRFMLASLAVYAGTFLLFFELNTAEMALMAAVLLLDGRLMMGLELKNIDTGRCPAWLVHLLVSMSRYSGEIYAFHLIALSWATGYPL
jgi:hypothetical protein